MTSDRLTDAELDGLVEALRHCAKTHWPNLLTRAADALCANEARIKELEAVADRLLDVVEVIYPSDVFVSCEDDTPTARELVLARNALRALLPKETDRE